MTLRRPAALLAVAVSLAAAALTAAPQAGASPAARCAAGLVPVARKAVVGSGSGLLCLPVGRGPTGGSRVDRLYGRVAEEVVALLGDATGRGAPGDVTVVCWGRKDWRRLSSPSILGYVYLGHRVVNLSPRVCGLLDRIAYRGERPTGYLAAAAVDTLAHEAIHVAGVRNEARTECYAMQLTRATAIGLGAGSGYAIALARVLWEGYDEYGAANPDYHTPACRDGGPLDLNPDYRGHWP
jgi:hypothetical protein